MAVQSVTLEVSSTFCSSFVRVMGPTSPDPRTMFTSGRSLSLDLGWDQGPKHRPDNTENARLRLLRLSEAGENLVRRAAMDVQNGKEDEARDLLVQKKKVVRAMDRSRLRIQLLDDLSSKIDEVISRKESELISKLNEIEFQKKTAPQSVHIISPSPTTKEEDSTTSVSGLAEAENSTRNASTDAKPSILPKSSNGENGETLVHAGASFDGVSREGGSYSIDQVDSGPATEGFVGELDEEELIINFDPQNKVLGVEDPSTNSSSGAKPSVLAELSDEENKENLVHDPASPNGIFLEENFSTISDASVVELIENEEITNLKSQNQCSEEVCKSEKGVDHNLSSTLEIPEQGYDVDDLISSDFDVDAERSFLKGINYFDELMRNIDGRLQDIETDLGMILSSMTGEEENQRSFKAEQAFKVLGDIQMTRERIKSIILANSEGSLQHNIHPQH